MEKNYDSLKMKYLLFKCSLQLQVFIDRFLSTSEKKKHRSVINSELLKIIKILFLSSTDNLFVFVYTALLINFYTINNCYSNYYPGRIVRPWNGRFRLIPVILWKQYSGQKFFGFFPMLSAQFLPGNTGSWQESTGQFPAEILLPCSGDFQCFPAGSGGIHCPESSTWVSIKVLFI